MMSTHQTLGLPLVMLYFNYHPCTVKESAAQQVDLQPVFASSSEATASYNGTMGPSIIIKRERDGSLDRIFG